MQRPASPTYSPRTPPPDGGIRFNQFASNKDLIWCLDSALENGNLEQLKLMKGVLELDSEELNRNQRFLYEYFIDDFQNSIEEGYTLQFAECVEKVQEYLITHTICAKNIADLYSTLDLTPWPILDLYDDILFRHRDSREHAMHLSYTERAQREQREHTLVFSVSVLLVALQHRGLKPGENAFMQTRANVTPLMYAIQRKYPDKIIHALFSRGGFSTEEWESGKVMGLLCTQNNIGALAKHLKYFCHADVSHRINDIVNGYGTVLHHFCNKNISAKYLLADLKTLIEFLRADSTIKNKDGKTASQILEENMFRSEADDNQSRNLRKFNALFYLRQYERHGQAPNNS